MRVLAAVPEHERESTSLEEKKEERNAAAKLLARRLEQAKALKYREKAAVEEEPGAERRLVASNQGLQSSQRIQRFYNAYSKAGRASLTTSISADMYGPAVSRRQIPNHGRPLLIIRRRQSPHYNPTSQWRQHLQISSTEYALPRQE